MLTVEQSLFIANQYQFCAFHMLSLIPNFNPNELNFDETIIDYVCKLCSCEPVIYSILLKLDPLP